MKLFVFGMGPMRWEHSVHLFALSLRSWHFARALADAGHDVTLLSLRRANVEGWPADKITWVERDGVRIGSVSEHLCHERPDVVEGFIAQHDPDAIVGVNTYPASVAVNFVRNLPFWADVNGDPMVEGQARAGLMGDDFSVFDWYGRLAPLLQRADRFSTCSSRQAYALIGQLSMMGRLTGRADGYSFVDPIPNSLDDEELELLETERPTRDVEDEFVVLWSGGYNTWADPDVLFEALEVAMRSNRRLRFVSLGGQIPGHDDVTYRRFRARVRRSEHRARYRFPGWVMSDELRGYYEASHAAICVDRWTLEGVLGARTRMMDWLAAGLPIVTTELTEISEELVSHGAALGAPCGDVAGLARNLLTLADDPAFADEVSAEGRAYASAHLRASRQLEPLTKWAEDPQRAPDAERCLDLSSATSRWMGVRRNLDTFQQSVRGEGWASAARRVQSLAVRRAAQGARRVAARRGLVAMPEVPAASMDHYTSRGLVTRSSPDGWRRRFAKLGKGAPPTVGVVVYVPPQTNDDVVEWTLEHLARQYYEDWRGLVILGRGVSATTRARVEREVRARADRGLPLRLHPSPDAHDSCGFTHDWIRRCDNGMLLAAGDLLQPDALSELSYAALERSAPVVYADETDVDERGVAHRPHLKPGWSPEFLLSYPYIGQPLMFAMERAPGDADLRLDGPDRALAYALALHVTAEKDGEAPAVAHVPRILLRRWVSDQVPIDDRLKAEQDLAAAEEAALRRAVWRWGLDARVERGERFRAHRVRFAIEGEPLVSIVIPTRDRLDLLRPCLDAHESRTSWANREVIIVDNGSVERETLDFLAQSPYRVVRYDEPYNFSRLNNRAVFEESKGEHVLLLNNDTQVVSPDWIESMLEHSQRPGVGAVGAKLIWLDGVIQHAGIAYMPTRFTYAHGRLRDAGQDAFSDCVRNFSAVTAACVMIPRAVFDEVGGFDEEFVVAYNDVDLCLRIVEAGYRIVYTPHAVLYHEESSTRGYGRQPPSDDHRLEERWLSKLGPDPYLGMVGLRE